MMQATWFRPAVRRCSALVLIAGKAFVGNAFVGSALFASASASAIASPDADRQPPARDPMRAPAEARPAGAAASAPAAAPAPARHLMVVDGRRYVVWGGRKRGVGDLLGDARIERIEDSAVIVRQDGIQHRLPLFGAVQRKPASEAAGAGAPPVDASVLKRPARLPDAGALSLARPERPLRPELHPELHPGLRPDFPYRAGDPQ